MLNYNNKLFKVVSGSANSEVDSEIVFVDHQTKNIISSNYSGGKIVVGHLLGLVNEFGAIEMTYHQINKQGVIMTGKCHSIPEILPDGKIRLHEKWQWTSGDCSIGASILEEV